MRDDGFGGREPTGPKWALDPATMLKLPEGERALTGQIAIGSQGAVLMQDIKMTSGRATDFAQKNFFRGQIEVRGRKGR